MKLRPQTAPSAPSFPSAPAPPEESSPLFSRPWFVSLVLAVVTFAVFRQVTTYPFVEFDDQDYILSNPHVQGGLSPQNVAWAFGSSYASNWHPVTWISHMLDADLFGPNAAGPHLVNLLLHIANTLLLFAFWRQATGALWRSAFVAALFALHPLHVESVAWVAERKDVLSGLFALLTLLAYLRYTRLKASGAPPALAPAAPQAGAGSAAAPPRPPGFYYLLALGWFALGLMSKPMLVTFPILLLLLDYWPLRRFTPGSSREAATQGWTLVREKLPFLGLAAMSCLLTLVAQQQGGALRSLARFSLSARIENALVSYARYLGKTFWPVNLSLLYPHPGHWSLVSVVLSTLLLLGLCAAALLIRRRLPYAFSGWYWFFISLVPVIGLVQVGEQSMADRYMYLPSIGLFAALAWGGAALLARCRVTGAGAAVVPALVLVTCAVVTTRQVPHWRDTESLYLRAIAVTSPNPSAVRFLAYHYYNLGNAAKDAGHFDEAIARYRRSLELDPGSSLTHNNLGMAIQNSGHVDEAIAEYIRAVQLQPGNANARNNLGVALAAIGRADEAVQQLTESVRLDPNNAGAHNNLGALLFRQGKFTEAIPEYTEAVRLSPGSPAVLDNLGDALARAGRGEEAGAAFRRALQLNPNDPVARKRLSSPSGFKLTPQAPEPAATH